MKRRGAQNHDYISAIYRYTGLIADLVARGRIDRNKGIEALEACREISRHLYQGNSARAWCELQRLLGVFKITNPDGLKAAQFSKTRRLFTVLTEDENRRPEWDSLPIATAQFFSAMGVKLRPVWEELVLQVGPRGSPR